MVLQVPFFSSPVQLIHDSADLLPLRSFIEKQTFPVGLVVYLIFMKQMFQNSFYL